MKRREFLVAAPIAVASVSVRDAGTLAPNATASASSVPETQLVARDEPGVALVVSGAIYGPDGSTPARGVRLFLYHTDAQGYYSYPRDNPRDSRIRGWVTANEQGRYRFRTIRPAHYASGWRGAAHIHTHVHAPDAPVHWIDSFLFADDRYLAKEQRAEGLKLGALSPVMQVSERGGVAYCTRDIRLEPRLCERNRLVDDWR
ncbi:MAG: hypothetical protein ACRD5W_01895 [Candidatus Acidiferrales bacterium]